MENNGHEEVKEIGFPREFNTCPNCGGKEFVFEKLYAEERAKGKISDLIKEVGLPMNGAIFDPTRPAPLSFPVIIANVDICLNCGTLFAKKLFKQVGQPQMAPSQPLTPRRSPFQIPGGMPPSGMFGRG